MTFVQISNSGTVEVLLALSIFHKRVIQNLDGAIKFQGTVHRTSGAEAIAIGSYDFNKLESNRVTAILICQLI
jgi:hypothetical protein